MPFLFGGNMETIKFKKDVNLNGEYYFSGQVISVSVLKNKEDIWKLNEKGFIEPITYKEYLEILKEKSPLKQKIKIEEE